ncbi:peptidoglycan-binding domain-containing protein [Methylocapsa polymorpha]|uniref:Peptidoglycan-binding domain-containing protein n=1 Tax=Methylocapsa polymorpha TaxID=3080828 RepID=A0ABZ0HU38_9HYPH|nr:peptidoglycan-binding domain-containing protein [Methylocapsa sp. RX1]
MREALAAADHDFVLAEPASKSKRTRAKAFGTKGRGSSRRTRRYLGVVASALCAATVVGILVNALTLQKTRHPAPLFGRAAPVPTMREPSIAETIPLPAPRPALNAAAANSAIEKAPIERSQTDQAPASGRPHAPPAETAEAKPQDPISQLLKTPAPLHEEKPAAAPPAQDKSVLAAQRALVKLGFVLKPDGVAGPTMRRAIERYERDRGLPVHGELRPSLLRRLSAESGISIR